MPGKIIKKRDWTNKYSYTFLFFSYLFFSQFRTPRYKTSQEAFFLSPWLKTKRSVCLGVKIPIELFQCQGKTWSWTTDWHWNNLYRKTSLDVLHPGTGEFVVKHTKVDPAIFWSANSLQNWVICCTINSTDNNRADKLLPTALRSYQGESKNKQ